MPAKFFKADSRSIISGNWGDYGYILQNGMTMHSAREAGYLALERTGPYIPPITFPGMSILLTNEARESLEQSGLNGFEFLPVVKKHISELNWEKWNLTAPEPQEYPDSGEPEDYILGAPHSPTAATAMGEIWEVVVPNSVIVLRSKPVIDSYKELRLDLKSWNGADLVRSIEYGRILFSQNAQEWFSKHWNSYMTFESFPAA